MSSRGKKPRGSTRAGQELAEDTMRVRVRKKNPLIERKPTVRKDSKTSDLGELRRAVIERSPSKKRREREAPDLAPRARSTTLGRTRSGSNEPRRIREATPTTDPRRRASEVVIVAEEQTETTQKVPTVARSARAKTARDSTWSKGAHSTRSEDASSSRVQSAVDEDATQISPAYRGRRVSDALPEIAEPSLDVFRRELSREVRASLERTLAGELEGGAFDPALSPKRTLEHLIHEPLLYELRPPDRARLLEAIARAPRDVQTIRAAATLVKSGVAKRLRSAERDPLFATFLALEPEARTLFAHLGIRPLRRGSALEDRDFQNVGITLGLRALVQEVEVAPEIEAAGFGKSEILSAVLRSIAHPEQLAFEEGAEGVLSIIEFALADTSPAELVRIWTAVVSGPKRSPLAGDGELDLGARLEGEQDLLLATHETPIRLALELLSGLSAPRGAGDRGDFLMAGGVGVDVRAIARALSSLYGVGYSVWPGALGAIRALERVSRSARRVPPVFVTALYEQGERVFVFDHLTAADVFVRAPHGRSSKQHGARRTQPLRFVEDPGLGLDRIPIDDFREMVGVALVPR